MNTIVCAGLPLCSEKRKIVEGLQAVAAEAGRQFAKSEEMLDNYVNQN